MLADGLNDAFTLAGLCGCFGTRVAAGVRLAVVVRVSGWLKKMVDSVRFGTGERQQEKR